MSETANMYELFDTWESLCREGGTLPRWGHRSLHARDALRLPGAAVLRVVLGEARCRSPKALGRALRGFRHPGEDGRYLRRATTGRWYVERGRRP